MDIITINKKYNDLKISLIAVKMGEDFNISILGGDKPHIGAVALAIPRSSLANSEEVSATASLLTVIGHKEDEVVLPVAKKIAKSLNSIVVVSCGIHKDDITISEIKIVMKLVNEAVDEFIEKCKSN